MYKLSFNNISSRWRPSKSQRRDFAIKMQDSEERVAYEEHRRLRNSYEGFKDKFFIPTKLQYNFAMNSLQTQNLTPEQEDACNQVSFGYINNEKIHHDYIHIINEMRRSKGSY